LVVPDELKMHCITLTTFVGSWGDDQLCCYCTWFVCYWYWSCLLM